MHKRATELIQNLELQPHIEGGWYREFFRSPTPHTVQTADQRGVRSFLTVIYFLLDRAQLSRWHRVRSDEVWTHLEGGPLRLHEWDPSTRSPSSFVLGPVGPDTSAVHVVPSNHWQAAEPLGDYSLVSCAVAPGFDFADFTMGSDDPSFTQLVHSHAPSLSRLL